MNSSFFRTTFTCIFVSIIFIVLCFSTMVNSLSYSNNISFNNSNMIIPDGTIISFSTSGFLWPTPGYTTITSPFGYRNAPTSGASSYHSGIDIGAPQRSKYFGCIFGNSYLHWF